MEKPVLVDLTINEKAIICIIGEAFIVRANKRWHQWWFENRLKTEEDFEKELKAKKATHFIPLIKKDEKQDWLSILRKIRASGSKPVSLSAKEVFRIRDAVFIEWDTLQEKEKELGKRRSAGLEAWDKLMRSAGEKSADAILFPLPERLMEKYKDWNQAYTPWKREQEKVRA